MIVTNTTPLINLGRYGKLFFLWEIFKTVIIPEGVYYEVLQKSQNPETLAIKQAIKEKSLVIEKAAEVNLPQVKLLGQSEKEAIALAIKKKCIFLTDDNFAKSYALFQGIEVHGTMHVLTRAVIRRLIKKEEAKKVLEKMISAGFYVSTNTYAEFINSLEKI